MKKLVSIILVLMLPIVLASCSGVVAQNKTNAAEQSTEQTEVAGENDEYKYIEYSDHVVLTSYKGSSQNVTLPQVINEKKVTDFGTIFRGSLTLVNITIPATYTSVDDRAFYECYKLSGVSIAENGVKSIGEKAFFGCQALQSARIPATVTDIASDAFQYCTRLFIYSTQGSAAQAIADASASITFLDTAAVVPETTTAEVLTEENSTEVENSTEEDFSFSPEKSTAE